MVNEALIPAIPRAAADRFVLSVRPNRYVSDMAKSKLLSRANMTDTPATNLVACAVRTLEA